MEGNSDELDEPIKAVFADVAFVRKHNLMSLNSINWSRVLVQMAHHFFAYFRCVPSLDAHPLPPVEVVVPTGAAGNLAGKETLGGNGLSNLWLQSLQLPFGCDSEKKD